MLNRMATLRGFEFTRLALRLGDSCVGERQRCFGRAPTSGRAAQVGTIRSAFGKARPFARNSLSVATRNAAKTLQPHSKRAHLQRIRISILRRFL